MTTARLISLPPLNEWLREAPGRRALRRDLVVDLGVTYPELWGFPGVSQGPTGTTYVTVPAGFDHDGSSQPAAVGLLLGDEDKYEIAGIVHDYLYRVAAPRGAADAVFWRIARSAPPVAEPPPEGLWERFRRGLRRLNGRSHRQQVGRIGGALAWAGLRVGAWPTWRRYARARAGPRAR